METNKTKWVYEPSLRNNSYLQGLDEDQIGSLPNIPRAKLDSSHPQEINDTHRDPASMNAL